MQIMRFFHRAHARRVRSREMEVNSERSACPLNETVLRITEMWNVGAHDACLPSVCGRRHSEKMKGICVHMKSEIRKRVRVVTPQDI